MAKHHVHLPAMNYEQVHSCDKLPKTFIHSHAARLHIHLWCTHGNRLIQKQITFCWCESGRRVPHSIHYTHARLFVHPLESRTNATRHSQKIEKYFAMEFCLWYFDSDKYLDRCSRFSLVCHTHIFIHISWSEVKWCFQAIRIIPLFLFIFWCIFCALPWGGIHATVTQFQYMLSCQVSEIDICHMRS